ncbi:MAG: hypothetical protein K2Y39_00860 [Candidatus Obscuribacterales bacterium]|nr:hypothetical protein [Candidatus Obscuribacterales bacterium]
MPPLRRTKPNSPIASANYLPGLFFPHRWERQGLPAAHLNPLTVFFYMSENLVDVELIKQLLAQVFTTNGV